MKPKQLTFCLSWPGGTWTYTTTPDMKRDRSREALETWYHNYALEHTEELGEYSHLDIESFVDGCSTSHCRLCWNPVLFRTFFDEGGEPWNGRYFHFTISLTEIRDHHEHIAA